MISGKTNFSAWNIDLPTLSPHLSHLNFYFWVYLKERIYQNIPQTVTELKEAIGKDITVIGSEVRKRVINIMIK